LTQGLHVHGAPLDVADGTGCVARPLGGSGGGTPVHGGFRRFHATPGSRRQASKHGSNRMSRGSRPPAHGTPHNASCAAGDEESGLCSGSVASGGGACGAGSGEGMALHVSKHGAKKHSVEGPTGDAGTPGKRAKHPATEPLTSAHLSSKDKSAAGILLSLSQG